MKVIALVDGEHYPAVTRWGLDSARAWGYEVLAALAVGGTEKLGADGKLDLGDVPVTHAADDPARALAERIDRLRPEAILDLSDEPVLGYERRMELVAVALARGVPYIGPDFRFDPPIVEAALPVATLAVIGTGKRVAKTAVSGHVARLAAAGGRPIVVAMGRGGPPWPVVARPGALTVEALLATADRDEHAASDYLEDALTSGVTTVGARRCGGGLAGRPFVTNVAEAAARAVELGADLVVLEGSGAAVPTVPWDAGVLVVPASLPTHHLAGYLGPLRLLLSDLVVFIIGGGPSPGPDNLSALYPEVRRLRADIRTAIAELQPVPLADVRGKDVFFATTANQDVAERLAEELARTAGCRVVKFSARLADRVGLEEDLASAPPFDVLLTELKAAAIDVAARRAVERGAEVVFVDNRPRTVGGDGDLDELLQEVVGLARSRADHRLGT
ncbi:MAG: 2,3-diphosphoglycerate synthetase [Actinomycetota bacterium]